MKRTAILVLLLAAAPAFAQVTVAVVQPAASSFVGDQVSVVATASGPHEVANATASIGAITQPLAFSASAWRGTLDISALPRGSVSLTVQATDALGNSGSTIVSVTHDRPPALAVSAPGEFGVARPQIGVSASCADDDSAGCASIVASVDGTTVMSGTTSLDGTADLSAWDGESKALVITATDGAGQSAVVSVPVFVESSARITKLAEVPGEVLDVDGARVLYHNASGLFIRALAGGTDVQVPGWVPNGAPGGTNEAYLTEAGAVYVRPEVFPTGCGFHLTGSPYYQARSWESGALVDIGCIGAGPYFLRVSGRFAALGDVGGHGNGVHRRDVVSGSDVEVASALQLLDLAGNGAVVYRSITGTTELYRPDGATSVIENDWADSARTDGSTVVYVPRIPVDPPSPAQVSILRVRNGIESALVDNASLSDAANMRWALPDTAYQAANDTVAYVDLGPTNVEQVWRSSAGSAPEQLTFGSAPSIVDRLADDGSVLFASSGRRFLVPAAGSAAVDVGSTLGKTIASNGSVFLALGNSAFVFQLSDAMLSPGTLDFGSVSMGTTSTARPVTVMNLSSSPVTFVLQVSDPQFIATGDCSNVAPGALCTIQVSFAPQAAAGALNSTVAASATLTVTGSGGPRTIALAGTAEKSLVSHYYAAVLGRVPDASGHAYWAGEAARMASLGADPNEVWFVMARYFFASPEYQSRNASDAQYVTDLYRTFFDREPDAGGSAYWTGRIAAGMPREVVLLWFMFSPEFQSFEQRIFGNTAARPEVNLVTDFFRGALNRLPETDAFEYWVGQLRAAQCQGSSAVYEAAQQMSYAFLFGAEYANRERTNAQYVSDLYDSFLRRGGDLEGFDYWLDRIDSSALSRDAARASFIAAPEFASRIDAVVSAGCGT